MVLDPRWIAAPPEIVALIFEGGPGPQSIVAYATVMATEAANHQMSMAVSATNIAATSSQWVGLAGAANVVRGTALNVGGLEPLAAHCAKHVLLAQAAVDAYTMAAPSVIPSVACQANRDLWGVLWATNWFGQNFPGIAAQDLQYFGDYWPQNSSVGVLYATTLGAISAAAKVPPPVGGFDVAPAGMGSGVGLAQSAADTVGQDAAQAPVQGMQAATTSSPTDMTSEMSSLLGQGQGLISPLTQPVTQAANVPTQAIQSLSGPLEQSVGMFMNNPAGATAAEAAGAETIGGELAAGGGAAGGLGSGGAGAVSAGYSGAGLTSFTQPASTFEPEAGGRPTGRAGALNAADLRSPTARPMGGSAMPMSPAGMLGRGEGASGKEKDDVTHARIVVDPDKQGLPRRDT
jgi:PPE-repeat protein